MKNVWILERFVPVEETRETILFLEEMYNNAVAEHDQELANSYLKSIEKAKKRIAAGGYWLGYLGRVNYKDFCFDAKMFMRNHINDKLMKTKIRAVKAEIENNATQWINYKNGIVNEGVTRYLYATYK